MRVWIVILLSLASRAGAAAETWLPEIKDLHPSDAVFTQQAESVQSALIAFDRGSVPPPLLISAYAPKSDETAQSVAETLGLPVDSVVTLNRMETMSAAPTVLLVPNTPGVFVPRSPETTIERVLASNRESLQAVEVHSPTGRMDFYPGESLSAIEQALYQVGTFVPPISGAVVSSVYGRRRHPIRGLPLFHSGIDLAADYGTAVTAVAAGQVSQIGRDQRLGLWVQVVHDGGFATRYAHLRSVTVELKQEIQSDMIVGEVGSTGLSTGPHLHFELHWGGRTVDPARYIDFQTGER